MLFDRPGEKFLVGAIKALARLFVALGAVFALNCRADVLVRDDIIVDPEPGRFNVCHDGGCASLTMVGLSDGQWRQVREVFARKADSASVEREQIRNAIALFETMVGPMTGTAHDKGGTFQALWQSGQMDCIDESTNTTIYMLLLQKYQLLHWHRVADRATRWSLFSWPHTTAVIEELTSGQLWAVDSWFLDNGEPPFILPLKTWRSGWQPPPKDGAGGKTD